MTQSAELRDPWLVAAWPGMGSVALLAGSYLLQQLRAEAADELNVREFYEIQHVEVKNGLATVGRLPRSMFFQWRDPRGRRDLLIFVGEAQPTSGGPVLCQRLIEYAIRRGVKRFVTFAAMATQLQPGTRPRVFAVATDPHSLNQASRLEVEILQEGQITGLNGLLLAAGAERGLRGICFMGELPFFALGVPNPRAAQAVLERFTELAGVEIDFSELEQQAAVVDQNLMRMVEQMTQAAAEEAEDEEDEPAADAAAEPQPPKIDARTQHRIEMMFDRAQKDRSKAFELKQELDRLGVFKLYEDRFLDLFKGAE